MSKRYAKRALAFIGCMILAAAVFIGALGAAPQTFSAARAETAAETRPTQTAAPLTTIPATGDDLPLTLLVILCAVGAGGLAVLTVQARRRQ